MNYHRVVTLPTTPFWEHMLLFKIELKILKLTFNSQNMYTHPSPLRIRIFMIFSICLFLIFFSLVVKSFWTSLPPLLILKTMKLNYYPRYRKFVHVF